MDHKIFLPKTSFSLRAGLAKKEPRIQAWWEQIGLATRQQEKRKEAKPFILHDGPPYANGAIHMGHALNKVLKDFAGRCAFMNGKKVAFVPGWDCHGLPIESKVEENYRKQKRDKRDISPKEFRAKCREFAAYWIAHQKEEMKRLGVIGFWEDAYETMDPIFEGKIAEKILTLLEKGYITQGVRPTLWSPEEGTALAEAEVEYKNIISRALYIGFPLTSSSNPIIQRLLPLKPLVAIWTTTPWTIPANQAICYGKDFTYLAIKVKGELTDKTLKSQVFILAKDLLASFQKEVGFEDYELIDEFPGSDLEGSVCFHPFHGAGYDFQVPLLEGEHVVLSAGTGLVHTAPHHGVEDFAVAQSLPKDKALTQKERVDGRGIYFDDVPLFHGQHIWQVAPCIEKILEEKQLLIKAYDYHHSYPHSWRSKTPLIYRVTPQWFIAMDHPHGLRDKALRAAEDVTWLPSSSKKRMVSMISSRPDWCISRQRVWGIPIPFFVHKQTGKVLVDPQVNQKILHLFQKHGTDIWFDDTVAKEVLSPAHDPRDYDKIKDIVDVWFESGVTQAIVLKGPYGKSSRQDAHFFDLNWPADLCLEGSDQHRGWFQSSLMTACALEESPRAPYRTVLTHGYLLNEQKEKMSKSSGNALSPKGLMETHGADILRLWVANSHYTDDVRVGPGILEQAKEMYSRFRNTLRYLLGNLNEFHGKDWVPYQEMPILEQWVLGKISLISQKVKDYTRQFKYQETIQLLHNFCSVDLSSFYFDIRKDTLYCDLPNSFQRKSCQTVLVLLLSYLSRWLAPFLPFTMEEVWTAFGSQVLGVIEESPDPQDPKAWSPPKMVSPLQDHLREALGISHQEGPWTVHLENFPWAQEAWDRPDLLQLFETLREIRGIVTGALETARQQKEIGSSLQGWIHLTLGEEAGVLYDNLCALLGGHSGVEGFFKELTIVSGVTVVKIDGGHTPPGGVFVQVTQSKGDKCQRCWHVLEEVKHNYCQRCAEAVAKTP